jgi:hypothetical protein
MDLVVPLEALESVPQSHAPADWDRDHHDVHVVDEPGSKELADHGGTAAEAYILAVRRLAGRLERSAGEGSMMWNVVHRSISIDGRV